MARSLAFALALVLGATAPAAVSTAVPPVNNNTIPDRITVVGSSCGIPDPMGHFEIVIRDIVNNPVPNADVYLDFTNCTDLRLCSVQAPGVILHCHSVEQALEAFTDVTGRIEFDVMGCGTNTGATPGAGAGCLGVYEVFGPLSRYWWKNVTVMVLDQNGAVSANGVEVTDMVALLKDLGAGTYYGRSDYSGNGVLDVVDLSLWLAAFGTGASANGCPLNLPPVCN